MYTRPLGRLSRAAVPGPPSPKKPGSAAPATTATCPLVTLSMRTMVCSLKKTLPAASTAHDQGDCRETAEAVPEEPPDEPTSLRARERRLWRALVATQRQVPPPAVPGAMGASANAKRGGDAALGEAAPVS